MSATTKRNPMIETKRKHAVEVGNHQTYIVYNVQPGLEAYCLSEAVRQAIGGLTFESIPEGDTLHPNHRGWSRFSVQVSPPLCLREDCYNTIEHPDEIATQTCLCCQDEEE